jgi:hypothetical protein
VTVSQHFANCSPLDGPLCSPDRAQLSPREKHLCALSHAWTRHRKHPTTWGSCF